MSLTLKYVIFVVVIITASIIFLRPIIGHHKEYRVAIVNTSEHAINNIIISGAGANSDKIGPIKVGDMQDYYFIATQNGELTYTITQGSQTFNGIIRAGLQKDETGDVFVVMGEMHKIKIYDSYDSAY